MLQMPTGPVLVSNFMKFQLFLVGNKRILNTQELDTEVLQETITRTFENRHTGYDPNTMFFREDFGSNPIMETRWKSFMKKITAKRSIPFSEVVAYLQERLLPYWDNLNQ